MYGASFRKATNIWSNVDVTLPLCVGNTLCPFKQSWGFHKHTAQAGPAQLRNGAVISGTPAWKAQQMSFALLKYIMKHAAALH